jgi:hypothetical protein
MPSISGRRFWALIYTIGFAAWLYAKAIGDMFVETVLGFALLGAALVYFGILCFRDRVGYRNFIAATPDLQERDRFARRLTKVTVGVWALCALVALVAFQTGLGETFAKLLFFAGALLICGLIYCWISLWSRFHQERWRNSE